jgi:hypothetical protein
MIVLFEKQVHLQNDEGSIIARHEHEFLVFETRGDQTYLQLILR